VQKGREEHRRGGATDPSPRKHTHAARKARVRFWAYQKLD
jgi:hypothetical protein